MIGSFETTSVHERRKDGTGDEKGPARIQAAPMTRSFGNERSDWHMSAGHAGEASHPKAKKGRTRTTDPALSSRRHATVPGDS